MNRLYSIESFGDKKFDINVKKYTELKLSSKFKLPVEVEIVPCSIEIMGNVTINGLRLGRGHETL